MKNIKDITNYIVNEKLEKYFTDFFISVGIDLNKQEDDIFPIYTIFKNEQITLIYIGRTTKENKLLFYIFINHPGLKNTLGIHYIVKTLKQLTLKDNILTVYSNNNCGKIMYEKVLDFQQQYEELKKIVNYNKVLYFTTLLK